jgi:hypothetical protein
MADGWVAGAAGGGPVTSGCPLLFVRYCLSTGCNDPSQDQLFGHVCAGRANAADPSHLAGHTPVTNRGNFIPPHLTEL